MIIVYIVCKCHNIVHVCVYYYVVHILTDCSALVIVDNVFCIYGEWKAGLSGGWQDVTTNPTYEFAVPRHCEYLLHV